MSGSCDCGQGGVERVSPPVVDIAGIVRGAVRERVQEICFGDAHRNQGRSLKSFRNKSGAPRVHFLQVANEPRQQLTVDERYRS